MVVTGAASGIGRATARRLQRDGWRVVGVDLIAGDEGCDRWQRCDVTRRADVTALGRVVRRVTRDGTRLAGVVNVAGISVRAAFAELDEATWSRILDVNLSGAYRVTRELWPLLVEAAHGVVVNVASTTAFRAEWGIAAYAASKAGVLALTRCLALEGGPYGIRANAVAPGVTRTPLTEGRGWSEEEWRRRAQAVPLGRVAEPDDVADVIAFLVGDDSRYVSGEVVVVNGGTSVR